MPENITVTLKTEKPGEVWPFVRGVFAWIGFAAVVEAFNVRARSVRARQRPAAEGSTRPAASVPSGQITVSERQAGTAEGRKPRHRAMRSINRQRKRHK